MKKSLNPSSVLSKKYKDQPPRYAEGAQAIDENIEDFADMLEKASQEDANKTKIIDMKPNLITGPTDKMSGEDFVKTKEMLKKQPPELPEILKEKPPIDNLHAPDSPVGKAVAKMQKMGKFKRVLQALGKRAAKAVPVVGTGLGLASAAQAMQKGDKLGAALETASAVDPTPLSDIALAGKDVYDILSEKQKLGEQESPDVEFGDNKFDYRNELEKRKKIMGYK